jgi:hypothetical protein
LKCARSEGHDILLKKPGHFATQHSHRLRTQETGRFTLHRGLKKRKKGKKRRNKVKKEIEKVGRETKV